MKKGLGIRFQLTAGMVIMTVAGIGLIGLLSVKIVERSALMWKASQAGDMVGVVRAAFRVHKDGALAASFTGAALKEGGISAFRLTGPNGRTVLAEGSVPDAPGERFAVMEGFEAFRYGGGWFKGAGESLRVSAPVSWPGQGTGRLDFVMSLADINEDMAGVRRFLLIYAFLDAVIIMLFGLFLLSRSVVGPLKRLEEAATRIAGGRLYERARVDVENEIGSLAASFNSMAGRLEEEIRSLERVNVELLTAQDELLRSSTLAAVGRLAAGIAHEIGNPLGALRGYMDLLGRGGLDPAEEAEIVERASKETSRIDSIVREFLEVARPSRAAARPVDLNSLLDETLTALSVRDDFKGLRTELDLREGLSPVMADEGKLRQVFMNLLLNAAHSMEGRMEKPVRICTGAESRPKKAGRRRDDQPLVADAAAVEFVTVSISDSGAGISEDDARRIFDPFFTTKGAGRGTGLGLFVSQSIISAYGGEITLKSVPGEGSVFTVALPSGRRE